MGKLTGCWKIGTRDLHVQTPKPYPLVPCQLSWTSSSFKNLPRSQAHGTKNPILFANASSYPLTNQPLSIATSFSKIYFRSELVTIVCPTIWRRLLDYVRSRQNLAQCRSALPLFPNVCSLTRLTVASITINHPATPSSSDHRSPFNVERSRRISEQTAKAISLLN